MELVTKSGRSEFLVGYSLDNLTDLSRSRRTIMITDGNIRRMYGERLKGFELIEIGDGEDAKTLHTVEKIYEKFLELGVDKSHLIVGAGGGVVCDVTGFAASTYMRGLHFGFVPTTLLAQVDASIGGKNGVNLRGYKNLIGTIRQPEFCLIDLDFLKTLPRSELVSGLAEIVKSGALGDSALFEHLENHYDSILSLEEQDLKMAINSALSVKIRVVSKDEMEERERMKLNFGHTVGHAIEKVAKIPHGYAVSIGMVAAGKLSLSKGLLSEIELKRIVNLLQNMGLPVETKTDRNALMEAITKDKKKRGSTINVVLLKGIGDAVITAVEMEEVLDALDGVCT